MKRRTFLHDIVLGLPAIALQQLYAGGKVAPHHTPKAKRVLQIFCPGGASHIDLWDYKPELVKLDGKPLPGSEKLVTFQGENGNLAMPLWKFRPRRQSGKMISDLLPHLAELADEMCFILGFYYRDDGDTEPVTGGGCLASKDGLLCPLAPTVTE